MKTSTLIIIGILITTPCVAQRKPQGPMSKTRYTPEKLGYKLFWEDQFNGDKLDTNKWDVRGVGARAVGFVSPEAVKVEEFLRAVKDEDGRDDESDQEKAEVMCVGCVIGGGGCVGGGVRHGVILCWGVWYIRCHNNDCCNKYF